jgi:hypothetical protein
MATKKTGIKADLKKELKEFYAPKAVPLIVKLPVLQYLMIDGSGAIGSAEFKDAIEALFSVSYKAKFISKKTLGFDYSVMPLEGLWWADNMDDFVDGRKDRWKWTLLILQPEKIGKNIIAQAKEDALKKKDSNSIRSLRLEKYAEGKAAQMMHIGPFSEEHGNIMKLHELIKVNKGKFDGKVNKHHEIYLSDFRKVDPKKMRTVLRQPFVV